ncbi:hypothetical protein HMPREF9622_02020 [Cutibacterium modestum HL037PA3]|jgi:hypothetical protein|nr:hypothetical protein HMPREF9622_02020 [Cutibacterium modestum HL037PA3]
MPTARHSFGSHPLGNRRCRAGNKMVMDHEWLVVKISVLRLASRTRGSGADGRLNGCRSDAWAW